MLYNEITGFDPDKQPQPVAGDLDKDGRCSVSDVILLQKWLLGLESQLPDWQAGDLNGDNALDVFDLALLKHTAVQR